MTPETPVGRLLAALRRQPLSRYRVPTPALIVDLNRLERNIALMAMRAGAAGLSLRPHAKSHKSSFIAGLQIAAGAVGICCTKTGEAEALADAGVRGILLTSAPVGQDNAERTAALSKVDPQFSVVVDHPFQVDALQRACLAQKTCVTVLIDVDVGMHRTGISSPQEALELAERIRTSSALVLRGVQGYGGTWQHIKGAASRAAAVTEGMGRLAEVVKVLRASGHTIDVVTGGGTGTFAADAALQVLNEVQPGSYVFMDAQYSDALGEDFDGQFEQSLFVQARVVHANASTHFTIDAGLKAFATDGPLPGLQGPEFEGSQYFYFGDEHGGIVRSPANPVIQLGSRVELVPPHCDPTVDRYDTMVLVRDDVVWDCIAIEAARRSQ